VAAKTRERRRERDRHKIERLLSGVGATNFGRPYKPGIYTPRLGLTPFWHITDMACPLMDSVNTAIRCPYSTLPRNGRVTKIRKNEKRKNVQVLQIYKGANILRKSTIGEIRKIVKVRSSKEYE
jgi:hypothetical protein